MFSQCLMVYQLEKNVRSVLQLYFDWTAAVVMLSRVVAIAQRKVVELLLALGNAVVQLQWMVVVENCLLFWVGWKSKV